MTRRASFVGVAFARVVAAVGAVGAVVGGPVVVGCTLTPYPSNVVRCDPAAADCPAGYACLDVADENPDDDQKTAFCVKIGCGDGIVDPSVEEECDDANDNDLDTCVGCRKRSYVAVDKDGALNVVGLGNGAEAGVAIGQPLVLARDLDDNLFISAVVKNVVLRLDRAGHLTAVAGNGSTVSELRDVSRPNEFSTIFTSSIAVDGTGALYLADFQDSVIRRVDPVSGTVTKIAGNGVRGPGRDTDAPATEPLDLPGNLVVDKDGNVFFLDRAENLIGRVRRLDGKTFATTTFAQAVDLSGAIEVPEGALALSQGPDKLAIDGKGRLHIFTDHAVEFGSPLSRIFVIDRIVGAADDGGPDFDAVLPERVAFVGTEVLNSTADDKDFAPSGGCPPISANGAFVVDDSGDFGFWVGSFIEDGRADVDVVRADLRGDPLLCTPIAQLAVAASGGTGDTSSTTTTTLNLSPGGLAVFADDSALAIADPGNGVVWQIDDIHGAGSAPRVIAGQRRASDDAFADTVNELILELAKQTDGHLGVGQTTQCDRDGVLDFDDLEFYGAFPDLHRVVFVDCNSTISVLAGSGVAGRGGDGGPAIEAQLNRPEGATRAKDGFIYIADHDNNAIRRVRPRADDDPTLIIETWPDAAHSDSPVASITAPSGIAADPDGRLFISDAEKNVIWSVNVDDNDDVTVLAGLVGEAGGFNGDDHDAVDTQLDEPTGMVFLPFAFLRDQIEFEPPPGGVLVVTERRGHRLRGILTQPTPGFPPVFTIAGDGTAGDGDNDSDGKAAQLRLPRSVMLTVPSPDLQELRFFVVDSIDRVRTARLAVSIDFVNGLTTSTGLTTAIGAGPSRDDGGRAAALFKGPVGVAFLDARRAVVLDGVTGRLRLVDVDSGAVVTVSGMPDSAPLVGTVSAQESLPLVDAAGLAFTPSSDPPALWVTEATRLVRYDLVDIDTPSTWTATVVEGPWASPAGIDVDDAGRAWITDRVRHVVYEFNIDTGDAEVVAGVGARGSAGDDGDAGAALLNEPGGVAFVRGDDGPDDDAIVIADTGNHRLRRVELGARPRIIRAILGDGDDSSGGEGAPANGFPVAAPRGIDVDAAGNVVATSQSALRFLQSGQDRRPRGTDDVRSIYGKAPRVLFPEPVTRCLEDVAFRPAAAGVVPEVFVVDSCLGVLLRLRALTRDELAAEERARQR